MTPLTCLRNIETFISPPEDRSRALSVSFGTDEINRCRAVCSTHVKSCILDHWNDTPRSKGHAHLDPQDELCFF